jgi:hypothetical protein
MPVTWTDSVLDGLRRYTLRNHTSKVERRPFLEQELASMSAAVGSIGRTPAQTVSRVLQELRDEGRLFFSSAGVYVLTDQAVDLTREDLPEDVVENAIARDCLLVPDVPVRVALGEARLRIGQNALRRLTLANYGGQCAVCDTRDPVLLVTSHIARWTDRPDARGRLSNTICFCALHDRLFEHGYFGMQDDLRLIVRADVGGAAIRTWLEQCTTEFQRPIGHPPMVEFLREHRSRVGLLPRLGAD